MLQRGSLRRILLDVCDRALEKGSLIPLHSQEEFMTSGSVKVQLRVLQKLEEKEKATASHKTDNRNPFLPPEPSLYVGDFTQSHCVILNKFAVLREHGLIITKEFVEQTLPLLKEDFYAINLALQEEDYFIFFNSGKIAGASQPHKHIQFVPLPLSTVDNFPTPISPLLEKDLDHTKFTGPYGQIPEFEFLHIATKFSNEYQVDLSSDKFLNTYTDEHYNSYVKMLTNLSQFVPKESCNEDGMYIGPYNFLMTRKWMLIVPRSQEYFNGISVNSIGFAGGILVKNEEQKEMVKNTGFVPLLQKLTINQ